MNTEKDDFQPLDEIYKGSFFRRRDRLKWRVPIVCNAVISATELSPGARIMDVGCAIGDYVDGFYERGYKARGIEGSRCAEPFVVPRVKEKITFGYDLRFSLPYIEESDVCLCLEVAEHIEEIYADTLVSNLCYLSNVVIVSAAPPGQKGHHHVNCKNKLYWAEKFQGKKYYRNYKKEEIWRQALGAFIRRKEIACYYHNTMIFERRITDG